MALLRDRLVRVHENLHVSYPLGEQVPFPGLCRFPPCNKVLPRLGLSDGSRAWGHLRGHGSACACVKCQLRESELEKRKLASSSSRLSLPRVSAHTPNTHLTFEPVPRCRHIYLCKVYPHTTTLMCYVHCETCKMLKKEVKSKHNKACCALGCGGDHCLVLCPMVRLKLRNAPSNQ